MTADPFRHDDAAYVLGALAPQERAAFEAHLETCAECRARVADARAAAGLLDELSAADAGNPGDPGPIPETLLPGLLRRAGRERARRRWIIGSLAAAAAACAIALAVVLWPSATTPAAPALAFGQVRPSPVTATATLVAKSWGTEIDLHCQYSQNIERWEPYRLVVIDRSGEKHDAGSWTLVPGNEIAFTGGTAVQESDIARLQITLPDGSPILQLKL
ncbi:MAG: hypothetical protein QOI15_1285 [Pseudonocardiales bacterium]|jgi:anti-sigma factor RsiW|nr:hypothetical protein [Pseudonocardiales bacterium]MDT4942511.1 hypothetical protein [Pseudonocardiales bacterium]